MRRKWWWLMIKMACQMWIVLYKDKTQRERESSKFKSISFQFHIKGINIICEIDKDAICMDFCRFINQFVIIRAKKK